MIIYTLKHKTLRKKDFKRKFASETIMWYKNSLQTAKTDVKLHQICIHSDRVLYIS